jgi:hypothetical protein
MKKRLVSFVILMSISLLLVSMPIVSAQTYSGFNRFTDNIKLFFSGGDNKVKLALEIREKEVNSAIENLNQEKNQEAVKNLERAEEKLQIVQEKVSLATSEQVKTNTNEVINKVQEEESEVFEDYILEEQTTQLTAELTQKTYEYCKELAKQGYEEMLKEEICNPDTAQKGLEAELKDLKDIQIKLFVQLMLEIRSCIDDPGTCNCDEVLNAEDKAKCEKMVALAIKCEYKKDETSCSELKAMEPKKGDSFAESFIPDFLMNLFREKEYMIEYNINHSDGVPEECWDENDKPECEQYDYLKETNADWDEYGHYIGKRHENKEPTMQESIPQCYENDVFLEEKCGKIDKFENSSEKNTIDVNGTTGQNQVQVMKQEIANITTQIQTRTFAPGTYDTGNATQDVQNEVVEGGGDGSSGGTANNVVVEGGGGESSNVVDNVVVEGGGSGVTGEVVIESNSNNFVKKLFNWLF